MSGGGGDERCETVEIEMEKRKKASVVMDPFLMCQTGEMRRLVQEEDVDSQKVCKTRKVSQVKGSLQI